MLTFVVDLLRNRSTKSRFFSYATEKYLLHSGRKFGGHQKWKIFIPYPKGMGSVRRSKSATVVPP